MPTLRDRAHAPALGLRALLHLFDTQGHDLMLTTTVIEPIVNRAALPFLERLARKTPSWDDKVKEAIAETTGGLCSQWTHEVRTSA